MSHLTHYTSFWGQYYRSDNPTNIVTITLVSPVLKDQIKAQTYQAHITKM